jgi:anti-sigma factor RsiW
MNSDEWKELGAFVDGELEPLRACEIANQLQHDPALRRHLQEIAHLSAAMRAPSCYFLAPQTLRLAVRMAAAQRPRPNGSTLLSRWFAWRPMASALAVAGLLALSMGLT